MKELISNNAVCARIFGAVAIVAVITAGTGCGNNSMLKYYMWGSGDLNIECLEVNTEPGTYEEKLSISMSCNETQTNSYIIYTMDGTAPSVTGGETERGLENEFTSLNIASGISGSSIIYNPNDPVKVELGETITIKAMAVLQNPWKEDVFHKSSVREYTYTTIKKEWTEVTPVVQSESTIDNLNLHVAASGNIYVGYKTTSGVVLKKYNNSNKNWATQSISTTYDAFAMCVTEYERVHIAKRLAGETAASIQEFTGVTLPLPTADETVDTGSTDSKNFQLSCVNGKQYFSYYSLALNSYTVALKADLNWPVPFQQTKTGVYDIYNHDPLSNSIFLHVNSNGGEAYVISMENANGLTVDGYRYTEGTFNNFYSGDILSGNSASMPAVFSGERNIYTAFIENETLVTGYFDGTAFTDIAAPDVPGTPVMVKMHGDESGIPYIAVKYTEDGGTDHFLKIYRYGNNGWESVGSFPEIKTNNEVYSRFGFFVRTIDGVTTPFVAFRTSDLPPVLKIYKYD